MHRNPGYTPDHWLTIQALAAQWIDAYQGLKGQEAQCPDTAMVLATLEETEIKLDEALRIHGELEDGDAINSIEPVALGNIASGKVVQAISLEFEEAQPLTIVARAFPKEI